MRRSTIIHRSPMAAPAIAVSFNRWRFGRFRVLSSALPALLLGGWILLSLGWPRAVPAQEAAVKGTATPEQATLSPVEIVPTGPHSRRWQRIERRVLPNGRVLEKARTVTELANGLNYLKDGQWLETREVFEPFQNGLIARQGPHQVVLSPNLNVPGSVDLLTADGARFQSTVLGLGLYDSATGAAELIAELQDSVGRLVAPNQVVYPDAMAGLAADIRYTYRASGFEQDVLVKEAITLPPGFQAATTRLEVWTEFNLAPEVRVVPSLKAGMESERIDFGSMRIGVGQAFAMDQGPEARPIPVSTRWIQAEGRTFLVEAVPYAEADRELARLGVPRQAAVRRAAGAQVALIGRGQRPFPAPRVVRPRPAGERIEVAALAPPKRALLLDYNLQNNHGDLHLKGDTTYYLSGTVIVTNLVIEGGAVLKYNTNAVLELALGGSIDLRTDPYRPIVFTARDDHSIGEQVGTNALSGYYANPALRLHDSIYSFQHLRFSYAREGISLDDGSFSVRHAQFTFCQKAVVPTGSGVAAIIENGLFYAVSNVVYGGTGFGFTGRNLTVHQCAAFGGDPYENGTVNVTNSLLVHMTNWGDVLNIGTNYVVRTTDSVFQEVGAGSHYLAAGSSHRDVATTNIGADLLKDLRRMTTHPPVVLPSTNAWTHDLVLRPQAQRDQDGLDMGYHYWPLDYSVGGMNCTGATMRVLAGVAIATRNVDGYGIGVGAGARLLSEGTASKPNQIVRYNLVQEQATTNWATTSPERRILTGYPVTGAASEVRARFTHWSTHANGGEHFYTTDGADTGSHSFRDSEFHNGDLWSYRPTTSLTNCLLNRSGLNLLDDVETIHPSVRQCVFRGGFHNFAQGNGGTWTFENNLFDDATIPVQDATLVNRYNAFTTNATRLSPAGSGEMVLSASAIAYQSGPLGRFYLPTNLTSQQPLRNTTGTVGSYSGGSTNASALGYYHFSGTTNNVKETNTIIDVTYHLVATDGNGVPLDTDGDGLPDYMEDVDGDGVVDAAETDWDNLTDQGFRVWIMRPRRSGNLP